MQWLIPAAIHPIFVHFAIALTASGVGLDAYALLFDRPQWRDAARLSLTCGVVAMAVAAPTGWWDHERWHRVAAHAHGGSSLMAMHQYAGWSLALVFSMLVAWRWRVGDRVPRAFVLVASVAALGILAQGHVGGQLVFGQAVGVRLPREAHVLRHTSGQTPSETGSGHPHEAHGSGHADHGAAHEHQ